MAMNCPRLSPKGTQRLAGYHIRGRCVANPSSKCHNLPSANFNVLDLTVRVISEQEMWAVADVHSAAFYPSSNFLFDPVVKLDRVFTLIEGQEHSAQKLPTKCLCLVAKKISSLKESSIKKKNSIVTSVLKLLLPSTVCDGIGLSRSDLGIYGTVTIDTIGYNLPSKIITKNGRRSYVRENGVAYLSNLAVAPEARKKKIGRKLAEACAFLAKKWGCWAIALHCDPQNKPAYNLYTKLGYVFPTNDNLRYRHLLRAKTRFDGTRLMVKLL